MGVKATWGEGGAISGSLTARKRRETDGDHGGYYLDPNGKKARGDQKRREDDLGTFDGKRGKGDRRRRGGGRRTWWQ